MENNMQHRHILLGALGLGCVGLTLYIVGFATPDWIVNGDLTIGFWETCEEGVCEKSDDRVLKSDIGKLMAGRAFEFLGILSALGGLILVLLRMVQPSVHSNAVAYRASLFFLAFAGVSGIIGMFIVCGTSACLFRSGYSLFLNMAGCGILMATAVAAGFARPEVTVPTVRVQIT